VFTGVQSVLGYDVNVQQNCVNREAANNDKRTDGQGEINETGGMMVAPFPPVQLANTFVARHGDTGSISHLKLQKLCYYTYGWWLAFKDGRLTEQGPQVWKLGPVFHPIYTAFSGNRASSIKELAPIGPFDPASVIANDESDESRIVDWVWRRYGSYTGPKLSDMTHEKGTPWYKIASDNSFMIPKFQEMPDNEIRPYFRELAQKEGLL